MNRGFVAIVAASVALTAALGASTTVADPVTETLLKTELLGTEGMEANVVRVEVEPGWQTERHIHPGHVFVYVTEGTIEVAVEGHEPRTISAGEVIYELPNEPMVGRNLSATESAKFIVFQVGHAGQPLTVSKPE